MTINTQVHLENGTKSTNTICEEKSKGNHPKRGKRFTQAQREKAQAARRELVGLTKRLKEVQQQQASEATTEAEANAILAKKPNALLTEHYLSSTGATELKTFAQWKDCGYRVQKGEKAVRVWGTPFKATANKTITTPDGEHAIETQYDRYPVVALYTNVQVQHIQKAGEKETRHTPPVDHTPLTEKSEHPHTANSQPAFNFGNATRPANNAPTHANLALAARLRGIAETLQKDIDHAFSERLVNTPKRSAQAAQARQKGYRLERTQKALTALADRHEQGTVTDELKGFRTKKSIYDALALRQEAVANGYHSYYVETTERVYSSPEAKALWALIDNNVEANQIKEARQQQLNAVTFANIPGYFPTPAEIVDRMCELADIQDGHTILEPEAGSGAILDRLTERYSDLNCIGYEIHHALFNIVNETHPGVLHKDFLTVAPEEMADRIVMNPPFERLQDIDHVQHAYQFLKPGGTLVAIMSPSGFFRQDKKAQDFRQWFDCNGYAQDLPMGSFNASGTNVNTKIALLEKPSP